MNNQPESEQALAAGPNKVFLSYSRSDKRRVDGIRVLLEALGNEVFFDHLSIRAGDHWRARIESGIADANVFLVFWTRYAARSKWVRKEYEHFQAKHPDKPLAPVRGDDTPLPETLAARQHVDFCPLINELQELEKSLRTSGISRKEIQVALLKRLEESGITLTRRQRRRVLKLFGAFGLGMGTMAAMTTGVDRVIDSMAQASMTQVATVGVLAAGAVAGYQVLAPTPQTSVVHLVPITEGTSGSEVCFQKRMSCLSLTTMRVQDKAGNFLRFETPDCDAKLLKQASCVSDHGTEFAVQGVCLRTDKGKQGIYEFAYCVSNSTGSKN